MRCKSSGQELHGRASAGVLDNAFGGSYLIDSIIILLIFLKSVYVCNEYLQFLLKILVSRGGTSKDTPKTHLYPQITWALK
jgi:hypothetical protein